VDDSVTADNTIALSSVDRVSSPASTGGAGTYFEQHVAAYWLALLLVGAIPPILHDCLVVEVDLQTEHLGWSTDDFLIIGHNGSGQQRKLAGQVKRSITISAADDEFKKAVQDYWADFNDPQQFSPAADRFALVILRGTNTMLEHFAGLLDCARAARDVDDFEHRLATSGFISKAAVRYYEEIRSIIGEIEGEDVSAPELWPFLRVLHVLSLDLNTSTQQTESYIRSLLAHTTHEQDASAIAETSWNALLREVGAGSPEARTYRREDLPQALRQRHAALGDREQRVLRALEDHSRAIVDGIRSTLGSDDLHLARGHLVQKALEQLEFAPVLLISGAAGSGKSGIAKDTVGILAADHFVFSFRAEEFAHPHLDQALQHNQIPANVVVLEAVMAGQSRKVLLVESVERLLEKSTRDAFSDLLRLVARDQSWRLVLTCRDYSTDLVRTCFLETASVSHSVLAVPTLNNEELEEVAAAYPSLARPLEDAALRRILSNPYVLDRALQIHWSEERPLPHSERELRTRFWREIIRADQRVAGGMPRRRETVFTEVALRRARALNLYANCSDLAPEVVTALEHDSLIVCFQNSRVLLAPSHDVLEDWTILQWMEEQYTVLDGSVRDFAATIGGYPALRRTYRKWVSELMDREPGAADRLFQAAVRDGELPAQFRDDTLISLLRSPSSVSFLTRHSAELFANNKQLLWRVIRLLRVAGMTTPAWTEMPATSGSSFNVPDGPAWACVLDLVARNVASFTPDERLLLLGFIEDWARGVSWQSPYPDGARSVAVIAHWLLSGFGGYRSDGWRKRTLQVIAKIPNADRERFAALLQGSPTENEDERDRVADDFRKIIFEGLEGTPAARDMPEAVISAARDYLLSSEANLEELARFGGGLELEPRFGIKFGRSRNFFPASAYRGPFLPLLRFHPRQGLDFMIHVFNYSADWYAHRRLRPEYLDIEPPLDITLTFEDGASRTQWCNDRLWKLYRGTSVGPYVLQCMLMALERFLLELAEAEPSALDDVLLYILRRSDSVALTAVVASVATAHPRVCCETLLVLLRSQPCIFLDRGRMATESRSPSTVLDMLGAVDARNAFYNDERRDANALPHRRNDLETAILNLQLGPCAQRVHQILDRHRAEMPPVESQNEEDRIWRLALHRMDLRQYAIANPTEDSTSPEDAGTPEGDQQHVRIDLNAPDPDVQEMVNQSATQSQALNTRLGLLMWALKVYSGEERTAYDPQQWRSRLAQARAATAESEVNEDDDLGRAGPGIVAAVCVRDHWDEMSEDERTWCVGLVCSEVEREANLWDRLARVQRDSMAADRPCAMVLPLLVGKSLPEPQQIRVRQMLVVALTHAIGEVRSYAALGVARYLWSIDRELVLRCVNALAAEATLIEEYISAEINLLYVERRPRGEIHAEAASLVRERFFDADAIAADAVRTMDPTTWVGVEANTRILAILVQAPNEPMAVEAFERLANTLVQWWDQEDAQSHRQDYNHERNYESESVLTRLLMRFVLKSTSETAMTIIQPILAASDRHPQEVGRLLEDLIYEQDNNPNTPQFWMLWELFAARVREAGWLTEMNGEHAHVREMMRAIFLGVSWKEDVSHWRSLEGHAEKVHALFQALPPSWIALDSYLRFLYHIGEQSLPEAFVGIAERLRHGCPQQLLRNKNTVYMLEVMLQKYVYGRPLELKRQRDLREAILSLLDILVESGSSAAFRMRDDFVTPISLA
jgi:hypothetical protein